MHTHTESVTNEDFVAAQFESFDRMVHLEGGAANPRNITAARERAKECLKRGKKYYKKCKFSKRIRYAMVVEGFRHSHTNNWAITNAGTASSSSTGAAAPAGGSTPAIGGGAVGVGDDKDKKVVPARTPKKRSPLEEAIAKA